MFISMTYLHFLRNAMAPPVISSRAEEGGWEEDNQFLYGQLMHGEQMIATEKTTKYYNARITTEKVPKTTTESQRTTQTTQKTPITATTTSSGEKQNEEEDEKESEDKHDARTLIAPINPINGHGNGKSAENNGQQSQSDKKMRKMPIIQSSPLLAKDSTMTEDGDPKYQHMERANKGEFGTAKGSAEDDSAAGVTTATDNKTAAAVLDFEENDDHPAWLKALFTTVVCTVLGFFLLMLCAGLFARFEGSIDTNQHHLPPPQNAVGAVGSSSGGGGQQQHHHHQSVSEVVVVKHAPEHRSVTLVTSDQQQQQNIRESTVY